MHVIGHEHVGVQPHADTVAEGLQMIEIEEVIVIGKETRGAIIAALDDMYGDTRKVEPGTSGHGRDPSEKLLNDHHRYLRIPYGPS